MNQESVIKTKNLVKEYNGTKVVKSLDLDIKKGEIYGFLGPNGAGKTTTMKMLLGLTPATHGSIEILGKDFTKENKPEILRRTGNIIENPSYYGHLTGLENISIIEKLLDLPKGTGERALEIVSLSEAKDKKVREYSLGMKQRLAIAMAIVRSPELLILDEPTNGLDPAGTKEIRELIKRLAHEHGITIMVSSHLLTEIEKMADHIGVIKEGEMIFQGSLEELNQKRRPYTVLRTSDNAKVKSLFPGLEFLEKDYELIIKDLDLKQRAELNRRIIQNNIDVYSLYEEQKSLEDLFLDLTETKGN